jgi:peroxin-3
LERELAHERENDEIIKTQMKAHFESIQMIVDSTTLPHAMQFLSIRISEEIDVSHVMDRLNQGKGMLSPPEKLQLWDELKILSMHCSHLLLLYQILFLTCIFMLFARFHEDGFVSVVCDNA